MTVRTAPTPPGEPSAPRPRRFYFGYWIVGAAFVAQFVSMGASSYTFGAFFLPMSEEFGWSRGEMTLARTIGPFVGSFVGFFIGAYVDRYGGRWFLRVGVVVMSIAFYLCSIVTELWQWWLFNGVILTVGASLIGNLVVNVTLSKWFVLQRGRMISLAAMGVSFSGVVLTPVATLLVDEFGWRVAWRVLAVGCLLLILPISSLMRRGPEDYGWQPDGLNEAQMAAGAGGAAAADFASSRSRRQALRDRAFYLTVFAFGLGNVPVGVTLIQTIPFLTDAGYGRAFAALMISAASIPSMLSKPIWGFFIDRSDARRLAMLGFVIMTVGLVVIVVGAKTSAAMVVVGYVLLGSGWGGTIPLQEVVWASYFGRRYLGAVRSAGLPFSLVVSASAPYLVSVYFDEVGNYDGAFLIVATTTLVAVLLLALLPNRRRDAPPAEAQL